MQNEKVIFRFSDSDLSAYLMMLGYNPKSIEIIQDKKHYGRLKAYICFEGNKEDLIHIQNQFNNNEIKVNPKTFSIMRKKLNKMINLEIKKYKMEC